MDGGTPDGQLEIWLEACRRHGLTYFDVEYLTSLTADWVFNNGDYYSFSVSPVGSGLVFAWHEVTLSGWYKWETTPGSFETFRSKSRGPSQGLAELLSMGDSAPLRDYWRELATSLIGLHMAADAYIDECRSQVWTRLTAGLNPEDYEDGDLMDTISGEESTAGYEAAEHLTARFQQVAEAPPLPDVEECFEAFEAACGQRAANCDALRVLWEPGFDRLPVVEFGIAVDTPEQVLYKIDPDGALHLNGVRTGRDGLEDDLLEQFPHDAWARLGARNAARDLLEIQRTAGELMNAQRQDTLQDMDLHNVESRVEAMLQGVPVDDGWYASNLRSVKFYCDALQERIQTYLEGFQRWAPFSLDDFDFTGL